MKKHMKKLKAQAIICFKKLHENVKPAKEREINCNIQEHLQWKLQTDEESFA